MSSMSSSSSSSSLTGSDDAAIAAALPGAAEKKHINFSSVTAIDSGTTVQPLKPPAPFVVTAAADEDLDGRSGAADAAAVDTSPVATNADLRAQAHGITSSSNRAALRTQSSARSLNSSGHSCSGQQRRGPAPSSAAEAAALMRKRAAATAASGGGSGGGGGGISPLRGRDNNSDNAAANLDVSASSGVSFSNEQQQPTPSAAAFLGRHRRYRSEEVEDGGGVLGGRLIRQLRTFGSSIGGGGGGSEGGTREPATARQSSVGTSGGDRVTNIHRATSFGDKVATMRSSQYKKSRKLQPHLHHNFPYSASGSGGEESSNELLDAKPRMIRRYNKGDNVLISIPPTRYVNLVNKYGFPPGRGETPEERRGPYKYVLASVKVVHFEEIQAYYTVMRMDTGADQRADVDYMEPIRSSRGYEAAMQAANEPAPQQAGDSDLLLNNDSKGREFSQNKCLACLELMCLTILLPFLWLFDCFRYGWDTFVAPVWTAVSRFSKQQAKLILYGNQPYRCRLRLTCVNFVVVCSTWYMFIDQARLAFFPPSADTAVASVNFAVWIILVLELLFEAFIRPDRYSEMIHNEKAFAPTTVRFISSFHLVIEAIALLLFVPEFLCIFANDIACDDRIPFSFYNGALMSVVGPSQREVFYGHAILALVRLRAVGLLRHWKNMWISNTFINMNWRGKNGMLSSILPFLNSPSSSDRMSLLSKKSLDPDTVEQKKKEVTLTNASTIGTALMVTNSYRAVAILWVIVGLYPIIIGLTPTLYNPVSYRMTQQMQGTNLVANDTSQNTCLYLQESTWAWLSALTPPDFPDYHQPYVLTLSIEPLRCVFQEVPGDTVDFLCNHSDAVSEFASEINLKRSLFVKRICSFWESLNGTTDSDIARSAGMRAGSLLTYSASQPWWLTNATTGETDPDVFAVDTRLDASNTVATA